jgi:hypothetical protein
LRPAITIIATTITITRTPKANPGPKQHYRRAGLHFFIDKSTDARPKSC